MKGRNILASKWFRNNFQIIDDKTGKPVAEIFDTTIGDMIAVTPELLKLATGFVRAIDDRISILNGELKESVDEEYTKDIKVQIAHWTYYKKEIQGVIAKAENKGLQ